MAIKIQKLGICDTCLGKIKKTDWYTKKGTPRLHCSLDCRQADNSRRGNPARLEKLREHIADGTWINPRENMMQDQIKSIQSRIATTARTREVAAGTWRNPALTDSAREKLSKPRKHSGALHSAIEKLRTQTMTELTAEERKAYLEYRKRLRAKLKTQRKNK